MRAVAAFKKAVESEPRGSATARSCRTSKILTYLADILTTLHASERAVRAQRAAIDKASTAELQAAAAGVFARGGGPHEIAARHCLAAMADGDTLRTQLAALRRLLKITPANTVLPPVPTRPWRRARTCSTDRQLSWMARPPLGRWLACRWAGAGYTGDGQLSVS
jgi:hypothetical protein